MALVEEEACAATEAMRKLTLRLKSQYMTETGSAVDYKGILKSDDFLALESFLLGGGLSALEIPTETLTRTAFLINLYNVLMIFGVLKRHIGTSGKHPLQNQEHDFFKKTSALVESGYTLSLDEIEHGLLRGNKPGAGENAVALFDEEDERCKRWSIFEVDARIHFALVCGAKGCPPIQVYNSKNLDRGLRIATKNFLQEDVTVKNEEKGLTLELSKIFLWYGKDFGDGSAKEIAAWIRDHGEINEIPTNAELEKMSEVKLNFKDYDWNLNSM